MPELSLSLWSATTPGGGFDSSRSIGAVSVSFPLLHSSTAAAPILALEIVQVEPAYQFRASQDCVLGSLNLKGKWQELRDYFRSLEPRPGTLWFYCISIL